LIPQRSGSSDTTRKKKHNYMGTLGTGGLSAGKLNFGKMETGSIMGKSDDEEEEGCIVKCCCRPSTCSCKK